MSVGGQIYHHLGPSWFPLGFLFVASFYKISGPFVYLSIYLFFDHTEQHAES